MIRRSLTVHPKDTVAMLLEPSFRGDVVQTPYGEITLLEDVDFAHKVAIIDHVTKQPVYKYGHEIGYMRDATPKGTWIHNHNMCCDRGK